MSYYGEGKKKLRGQFEFEYKHGVFAEKCCKNSVHSFDDEYVLWLERKLIKINNDRND